MVAPYCPVCGAAHATCGGPTTVVPIDQRTRSSETVGTLKRYPNPARKGAFLMLNDEDAERLGLAGTDVASPERAEPTPDVTNEGGSGVVTSSSTTDRPDKGQASGEVTVADEDAEEVPEGALRKGGPTAKARRAAAAEVDDEDQGDEDENDESSSDEPKDKARPAPSSSRRRRKA